MTTIENTSTNETSPVVAPEAPEVTPVETSTSEGSWFDSLPSDLKESASLKKYASVDQLAKAYVNAEKAIGKDKIIVPDKHATDEDYQKIYQKLGLPEKLEEYDVKFAEGADENFSKGFKEVAHKMGVLPKQAQKIVDWYNESANATLEDQNKRSIQATNESVNALKQELGASYDQEIGKARAVIKKFGGEDFTNLLNEAKIGDTPLSSHPAMVKFARAIADQTLTEGQFKGESYYDNQLSPEKASAKAMGIIQNMNHPYHDKNHPSHRAAVDEVQELLTISS